MFFHNFRHPHSSLYFHFGCVGVTLIGWYGGVLSLSKKLSTPACSLTSRGRPTNIQRSFFFFPFYLFSEFELFHRPDRYGFLCRRLSNRVTRYLIYRSLASSFPHTHTHNKLFRSRNDRERHERKRDGTTSFFFICFRRFPRLWNRHRPNQLARRPASGTRSLVPFVRRSLEK